uniref:hypothetical protein n=1 Tax=Bacillus amyloliquefaciens TaxID=1390 RepID=UPI001E534DEE|nr:hypothetical protein [Bacillus amyloliquefaciens]
MTGIPDLAALLQLQFFVAGAAIAQEYGRRSPALPWTRRIFRKQTRSFSRGSSPPALPSPRMRATIGPTFSFDQLRTAD